MFIDPSPYMRPQFFPAPGFWSLQDKSTLLDSRTSHLDSLSTSSNIVSTENLLKFHLKPLSLFGLDKTSIPIEKSPSEIIDDLLAEISEITYVSKKVAQICSTAKKERGNESLTEEPWLSGNSLPSCLEDISREDMEIVLLGTGYSLLNRKLG